MAIQIFDDGWSKAQQYNGGSYTDDSSYENNVGMNGRDASWYQGTWWGMYSWARKYVNRSDKDSVRLSKMSFLACPGHSNGLMYNGGGGLVGPSNGYGCRFNVSMYVKNGGSKENVASVHVPSIGHFNCYYSGYGTVSTVNDETSFGSISLFGPGSPYAGQGLERTKKEFTFGKDVPTIPPGGELYMHVRADSWEGPAANSLLVIQSYDSFFEYEFQHVDDPYIWQMQPNGQWEKKLFGYRFSGTEWIKMEGS